MEQTASIHQLGKKAARPRLQKKTDLQKERTARDRAIYKEYNDLVSIDGQSRTEVIKYLMQKHNIRSTGTIYVIINRVREQLGEKEEAI